MIHRQKKVATGLGNFGEIMYAISPKTSDAILNQAYKLFPDSTAAKKGKQGEEGKDAKAAKEGEQASSEGIAFAHLMKGVHW
jgi:hypothetical protein